MCFPFDGLSPSNSLRMFCSTQNQCRKKLAMNSNAISFYLESISLFSSLIKSISILHNAIQLCLYVLALFPMGISTMFKDTIRHIDFYIFVFGCRFAFAMFRAVFLCYVFTLALSCFRSICSQSTESDSLRFGWRHKIRYIQRYITCAADQNHNKHTWERQTNRKYSQYTYENKSEIP